MDTTGTSVVTGAFGYTGRYITQRLIAMGKAVKTLTGHPNRPNPFGELVEVAPLNFDDRGELIRSLQGAEVLYNTYWIRFARGKLTFDRTVENTRTLISAAEEAGLRRIVHISITNASADSTLPYFRGKGLVEAAVMGSNLSHAIVRPALIFGGEDILINNIAWFLRRFPLFAVVGSGSYRVQPIFVEDLAELAVDAAELDEDVIIDAVGPETFTFAGLVRLVADTLGRRIRLVHVRPGLALLLSRLVGYAVRDVVLTRDEIVGLMAELLISEGPPTGKTKLSDWLEQNAGTLGASYASELGRHYR